jgi:drug/metabolite transporter (DMT)-like permease
VLVWCRFPNLASQSLGHLWNSALGLLLVTGLFLGLTPPLGKLAAEAGIPPLLWAFVISFGAGGILFCLEAARRHPFVITGPRLRYFAITAVLSYALPNVLMFSAIPHLGAGYTSVMFTLSPVITTLLSFLLRVHRPNPQGVLGIAIGFLGALMVATTRGQIGQPAALSWIVLGLLIPLSLAAGNIYRSIDWPEGAGPLDLAIGSHLAAAALLFMALLIEGSANAIPRLAEIPHLVLAQVAVAASMFTLFFRLQFVGGPVYLSQIGYVGAAVGLLLGVLALGERYAFFTWAGAAIVALGVVITTRARGQS